MPRLSLTTLRPGIEDLAEHAETILDLCALGSRTLQAMMDMDKMYSGKSSSLADMGEINKECCMTVRDIKQKLVQLCCLVASPSMIRP